MIGRGHHGGALQAFEYRIIADARTDEFVIRNAVPTVRVRTLQPTDLATVLTRRGALAEGCPDGSLVVRKRER